MRKIALTVATITAITTGGSAVVNADPANAAQSDCPSGYVCIYPSNSFSGSPIYKWKTYGYHNISNVTGVHRFYNNQTGGASTYACSGSGGTGKQLFGLDYGSWADEDFGPVYSVELSSTGNIPTNC